VKCNRLTLRPEEARHLAGGWTPARVKNQTDIKVERGGNKVQYCKYRERFETARLSRKIGKLI